MTSSTASRAPREQGPTSGEALPGCHPHPGRGAMAVGLMAGVFGLYAHTIMPGLGDTDDRTFVGAFQAIDEAIENPLFLPTLVGALVLTGLAAPLHLRAGARSALPWIVAALVLYLAAS
jgi:uncharacterized membrane protein